MMYTFDKESLEYKKVDFRPLLVLPFILLFAFGCRFLFFEAAIVSTTDWRGKEIKITPTEYLKQKSIENQYDREYKEFIQAQTKSN